MARRSLRIAVVLALGVTANAQSPLTFLGRKVTLNSPEVVEDGGIWPKGPASVCLEGPERQCYTMPGDDGGAPEITLIQVDAKTPALFFSAESGGVSGFVIHFVLLRPGARKDLEDLFVKGIDLSEQSRHAFWTEPSISSAKIFLTADYIWGPDECHHCDHRYTISAYVFHHQQILKDDGRYFLDDQYMTIRKYDGDDEKSDILGSERQEIIARLRRAQAVTKPR